VASEPERTAVPLEEGDLFRLLVESVLDYAIFFLDPEGNITSWNQGAARIKGYAADEIVGRHFSIFYTPEAVDSGHPAHELEIATNVGRYEEEGLRVRKDGSRFWANVVITAVRDGDGVLRGFAKVTRDITERRLAEEALREARAEVERQRLSERQAVAINDNILQELVVAKYALEKGEADQTRDAIESTLAQTRKIISGLLEDVDVRGGGLRREVGEGPGV
jgi:PAS domain S-box-containing protein